VSADFEERAPSPANPPAEDPPTPATRPRQPKPPFWRRAVRYVERCLAFAGVVLIVYHVAFGLSEVVSPSMAPTLNGQAPGDPANDWILYETLSSGPPPRHGLIVFQSEEGMLIAKRVMAFPGETVQVEDGACLVDGVEHPLPDEAAGVRYVPGGHLRPTPEGNSRFTVPEGAVFVLGDDSRDSWDSRYFGALPEDRWRGRVLAIVWPPSRWSWKW
jgi:signal peptidase I